jgi:peptidoglycan/LPS O-acetylase OafA/YrhL
LNVFSRDIQVPSALEPLEREPNHRMPDLDSTRGFAALLVFLGHAYFFIRLPVSDSLTQRIFFGILRRLLDGGAAVDFFFVLSGFVLALPFAGDNGRALSVLEFIARRVIRIMPTYWAALLAALLLRDLCNSLNATLSDPAVTLMDWSKPLGTSDVISHIALIWRDFDITLINGPIWSLSVEMKMSLLLPLFIIILRRKQSVSESLCVLALSFYISARDHGALTWLPLFVLGVALARYRSQLVGQVSVLSRSLRLFLFVAACMLFWNRELQSVWSFPDVGQEWLGGMGGAIFLLLVLAHQYPPWLLANLPCRFLGKISYSFYLMHLPILQATVLILRAGGWSDWFIIPIAVFSAFAGAIALYFAVEVPSLRWGHQLSRWLAPRAIRA